MKEKCLFIKKEEKLFLNFLYLNQLHRKDIIKNKENDRMVIFCSTKRGAVIVYLLPN